MSSKNDDSYFVANNAEELLRGLTNKESYILITKDYVKEFEDNTELPLSENEQLGFNLGFRGNAGILSEIFYQLINKFSDGSKQQKQIDSRIRKYTVKKLADGELLLYLRQLDY
ncbi:hypothetical protein J27TS8_26240 [Robertmurraya siralis]|uniref:Uncharacterized protein n=1 Tax=Robertmurraya siralis TaxID=77777 RepID=A0A920BUI3_9BACI|nr:hypothetical protein [Robertmurraya siralis]GIN62631.1 hypothetical protein J27TS8_26240 [Robertmurraya siralis]